MAKSKSAIENPGKSQSSSAKKNAIFIIPLIALLMFIVLILVNLEMIPSFGWDLDTWRNFSMVVILLLIVVLICILPTGEHASKTSEPVTSKKSKKPVKTKPDTVVTVEPVEAAAETPVEFVPVKKEEAPSIKVKAEAVSETTKEKKETKPADIVAPAAKKDKIKPNIIEYPPEVEGGIYGDTFIEVNDELVLKLRTLVVDDIYLL